MKINKIILTLLVGFISNAINLQGKKLKEYLNTLTPEKQVEFLKKEKEQMEKNIESASKEMQTSKIIPELTKTRDSIINLLKEAQKTEKK